MSIFQHLLVVMTGAMYEADKYLLTPEHLVVLRAGPIFHDSIHLLTTTTHSVTFSNYHRFCHFFLFYWIKLLSVLGYCFTGLGYFPIFHDSIYLLTTSTHSVTFSCFTGLGYFQLCFVSCGCWASKSAYSLQSTWLC